MDSAHVAVDSLSSPTQACIDIELESKVKKASEKISENMHIFANEPSLACYRLQEHIQKSMPQLVLRRLEVAQLQRELQGKCYDLEYSINAVKSMQRSQDTFKNTMELIKKADSTKQQLSRSESHKTEKKKSSGSMYQRFSGSFDLPASFLPSGLSSSASASADLKAASAAAGAALSQRSSPSSRRVRASSVSSTPSHPPVSRANSASCSPTARKVTSLTVTTLPRGHSLT